MIKLEFMQIISAHPLTVIFMILCLFGIAKCVWTGFNTLFYWSNEDHKIVFMKENAFYSSFTIFGGLTALWYFLTQMLTFNF